MDAPIDAPAIARPAPTDPARSAGGRIEPCAPYDSRAIVPIRHDFDRHPLMQLPALAALARDLAPTGQCRFIRPGVKIDSRFFHQDTDFQGRAIDEVFARIEEPGAWVALYNVETHPRYRGFLQEVVDAFRPLVEPQQPGILLVNGFVFVSAPPSVTPFHIDRENNFWLQVRGRKRMTVWDFRDREVVAAADREEFILNGSLHRVRLRPEHRARGREFDVGPGDGVYFPSTSPHMTRSDTDWVRPGDGVSISIGVNFYTRATRQDARVHALNRVLRTRLGRTPLEPGQRPWLDRLKAPLGLAAVRAGRAFAGREPKPGIL